MLDELIQKLKSKLLQGYSLDIFCYYFINRKDEELSQLDFSSFTGEVEQIASLSFSEQYADRDEFDKIYRKLGNPSYRKGLQIYHFLGLSLQDALNDTHVFDFYLQERFDNQSFRYKYLVSKVFRKFEESLKRKLDAQVETSDDFILALKYLYLDSSINLNNIIVHFEENFENLDIIDLLLLEDLRDISSTGYNKLQDQLFNDILWCATEIQSKYKILNNKEDQFNSFFQSLLTAKNYIVLDQTQRGQSYEGAQYGELDIGVFTKENMPLSILEAFVISSVNKKYIIKHLKKLSENYNPTGLKNNYAVVYARKEDFSDFWEEYKAFVPTIDFRHRMVDKQVEDVTKRFSQFAGIRIGLTKHQDRGTLVQVFHIFMDMNL